MALTADRELVLVTLSYARGWRLPGGGVKRGEQPRDAVLRELEEEIGMISHGAVRSVIEFEHRPDFKRDVTSLFVVEEVRYEPRWSLEVKAVREFKLDALPCDLAPITKRLIEAAHVR
ncbi:MAG: NUDIX domain-containing protein [Pseudomonadota bacterium]|nr:NUDIX domain-containing protein [Pseudomonadota bacterium]